MHLPTPEPVPLGILARRLRVPPKWLREEADAGRLPHLRAGAVYLFDPAVVEQIIRARLAEAAEKVVPRG
jgi:hypothetical protein